MGSSKRNPRLSRITSHLTTYSACSVTIQMDAFDWPAVSCNSSLVWCFNTDIFFKGYISPIWSLILFNWTISFPVNWRCLTAAAPVAFYAFFTSPTAVTQSFVAIVPAFRWRFLGFFLSNTWWASWGRTSLCTALALGFSLLCCCCCN